MIKTSKKIPLYEACIRLFFIVYTIEYLLLYKNAQWTVGEFGTDLAQYPVNTPLTAILRVMANGFLLLALFLRSQHIKIRPIQTLLILMTAIFGIGWTFHALFTTTLKVIVYEPATPVFLLCCIFMLIGYEEELWKTVARCLPTFGLLYLGLAIWALVEYQLVVGVMSTQRVTSSALLYFFIYSFWLLAASVFTSDDAIYRYGGVLIVATGILVIMAMMFRSRGWMLQTLLLFSYTVVRNRIRWKVRWKAIFVYTICISLLIYVFWDMLFYLSGPLRERLFADSRSHQYEVFFQQVDIPQLIMGQGINATYSFTGLNTTYRYFDNQFILELFRYGIIPITLYTILLIRPIIFSLVRLDWNLLRCCFVLGSWILAMAGLSVYFALNINIYCIAMHIVVGRLNCLCEKKKERELKKCA